MGVVLLVLAFIATVAALYFLAQDQKIYAGISNVLVLLLIIGLVFTFEQVDDLIKVILVIVGVLVVAGIGYLVYKIQRDNEGVKDGNN